VSDTLAAAPVSDTARKRCLTRRVWRGV